jgi:hypothetical protein
MFIAEQIAGTIEILSVVTSGAPFDVHEIWTTSTALPSAWSDWEKRRQNSKGAAHGFKSK